MDVNIKLLNDMAIMPTKGSEYSAGYDLYAAIAQPIEIQSHCTEKIGTGIAIELPENIFGAIVARSGLATKQGLRLANDIGICDPDYRGEYLVALHNDSAIIRIVNPGDRIAQLIFLPFISVNFNITNELSNTVRGAGGFGSTGI